MDHYGVTISSFADKIGVQRSSVSHLLSGRNKPSLDFVMKLNKAYPEIDLYWLLNGKGSFLGSSIEQASPTLEFPIELPAKDHEIKKTTAQEKRSPEDKEISRIVIFYTDGTFESFSEKK